MTKPEPLLILKDLSKNFGGLTAVNSINLEMRVGEICGIIGPNGAGKTTLFNLIVGELRPNTGKVYIDGQNVTGLPSYEIARRGVARSFQLVYLFESMTVAENVIVGAERHDRLKFWSAATHLGSYGTELETARRRAAEAIALVGVTQLSESAVGSLSVGQQRLVATARALASQPRLLLLDEPATGLTQTEIHSLRDALLRIRSNGASVLVVEHNVEFVMNLCDHVVAINFGKKIADGTPGDVRHSEAVIEAYLGRRK